jgi:hypothetical protein
VTHVAIARIWASTGMSGVPVGTQVATPVMITTGWPIEVTRTAPTSHCAVTHRPLPAGGANVHPATMYGAAIVAIGIAVTSTRGLGAVGIACPP